MKYEIEIPDLPKGVRPIGLGVKPGEFYISSGAVWQSEHRDSSQVSVVAEDGYEFVPLGMLLMQVRSIPRKRLVIEITIARGDASGIAELLAPKNGVKAQWLGCDIENVSIREAK